MVQLKVCTACGLSKDKFYRRKASPDGLAYHCSECSNKILVAWQKVIKTEVMTAYGGKCACCGEAELKFLNIDHMNNDGAQHRREIGGGGHRTYEWLKKNQFPEGFQVLCANCNQGKQLNGGICPHKAATMDLTKEWNGISGCK